MYTRHPHGRGGDHEHKEWRSVRTTFASEESSIPSLARAKNGFLPAPFCWEHLTFHAKFPNEWKPKLQPVDQRRAGGGFHSVEAVAGGKWPGWDGSPAPGILLPCWATLSPSLLARFSTLWLQLGQFILVGEAPWGMSVCSRGCSWCQRMVTELEFPGFFVAVASSLSSPRKAPPQLRVKQAGKGPRKGKTGSLFIQMPWQWIGCNYSLKYSLVLIIQVAGNRRNTGETQPHLKKKTPSS